MAQGVAHAAAQGVLSLMQGQDFVSAFTSGLLGSYGASTFSTVAGKFASSAVGTIASGAILGGVGSELTGGNFWQGAAIGGFVAGFNHVMHEIKGPLSDKSTQTAQQQKNPWDLNGDGRMNLEEANNWYRVGKGKSVTLDASKLDLNFIDTTSWKSGKDYYVQTLFSSGEGRVLGNIKVHYLGDNKLTVYSDTYNFEQHGSYVSSPVRNVANSIGRWVAGKGMEYQINFKGINKITYRTQPTRTYP